MTSEQQRDPKFYAVGGAIQPGRECYLQRMADAELYRRVTEGEYCHVLAQPQAGKTSLVASTAARLRSQEIGVAVVDLDRISKEDLSENAGRWYYSIVYRIARDLRIKADLQNWWAERGGLTNLQRLREFFQEIVLQETDQPVVIFFDRLEVTSDEPVAQDLFDTIRACHDARATAADFNRLVFVMLAAAPANELVGALQGSAFEVSTAVQLDDFSPQEMAGLINGLGPFSGDPEAIISRVWNWTRGHPYLSQKVFRGLARRDDADITVAAVDELVQRQFNSPTTLLDEPHVSAIAERLLRDDAGRSARLNLYGRVRKGVEVTFDPASEPQHELLMAGVVTVSPAGELRVRNEIYATVFSTRWANQNLPFGSRGIAVAVVVLALLVALPVWYSEYLPRPYLHALNTVNQDFELAEDAYNSLSSLPGYGDTADRLFSDFLMRSSRGATELADVMRINSRLQLLPEGPAQSAGLLAEFWEREARRWMHSGDRDSALVAVIESLQSPSESRRRLTAELIGADYRALWATLHSRAPITAVRADQQNNLLTVLDRENQVDIWRLGPQRPEHLRGLRLYAEERLQIEQRQTYRELPGEPRLLLKMVRVQPAQVQVVLRSPGGQEAVLLLDAATALDNDVYAFDFNRYPQLRQLLNGELSGNWTLRLSDLERGAEGELLGWELGDATLRTPADAVSLRQPVPAPRASLNALTRLSDDGRLALSWPANPDTTGPLLVWDLINAAVLTRIPRGTDMRTARFALQGKRIVTVRAQTVEVWDSASGRKLGQFSPAAPGQPRLRLSPNGRYAAIAVQQRDAAGIAVWDLERLQRVSLISAADVTVAAVDSSGKYLATGSRDSWVRVWSLRDGSLQREFAAGAPLRKLAFDPQGSWLIGDDLSNTLRLWSVAGSDLAVMERTGSSAWLSTFAGDSGRLLVGSPDRSYQIFDLPEGRKSALRLRHSAALPAAGATQQPPLLLAGLNMAVTVAGPGNIKLWRLDEGLTAKIPARTLPVDMRTAVSPDGYLVAAGITTADLRIHVPGVPGGMLLEPVAATAAQKILRLAFSAEGNLLAAGNIDGSVAIWDTRRGRRLATGVLHADGPVQDLLFSANSNVLFSASRREVQVTDLDTGRVLARLAIQAENPQLAYADQSGEVFVAGDEAGVTQWNWRNGISEMLVAGDRDIARVVVTPSGRRLITAGSDGRLVAWDVVRRIPLQQIARAAAKVDRLWLAEDGRRLIVQAGYWLHALNVQPAGLAPRYTRLLSDAPTAAQPDAAGRQVAMLSGATSRPRLLRVDIAEPAAIALADDAAAAREYWHRLLAMSLDQSGKPQAVKPPGEVTPLY